MIRSTYLPMVLGLLATGLCADQVLGQQGTTIQLPSFRFQTVTTTVTVPDGGTVLLGGVKRAAMGRNERGVPILGKIPFLGRGFRNVGIGREMSSGMMTTTVQIHMFEELERQLLGDRSASNRLTRGQGFMLGQKPTKNEYFSRIAASKRNAPATALAELRRMQADEQVVEQQEAEVFFERAKKAEADGKPGVAKIYYRLAVERVRGKLKQEILAQRQKRLDPVENALRIVASKNVQ